MKVYLINIFSRRLIEEEIDKIILDKENIIKINFDDSSIEDIIDECSYFSLLDEEKVVIVNNFKLPSENKLLERYLENPNYNTTLILVVNSLDRRNKYYKKIKEMGTTIEIDELSNIELNSRIQDYVKSKGFVLDSLALIRLREYNLDNYDLILSDIDKISIITKNISDDDVNKYGSRVLADETFGLSDAIIDKKYDKIMPLLNDFIAEKKDVIPFVSLLASTYRLMLALKNNKSSNEVIAKELGIHAYRVKLIRDKSYNYSKDDIERILLDLTELDYNLKTLNVSSYSLLEAFILNI